jgi:hypothetical protein
MRNKLTQKNKTAGKLASIFSGGALAAGLAFGAAALLPMAGPASALPKSCVIRTYYKAADLAEEVGMRSSCPGVKSRGKTSKFVEVETVDLQPEGPGGAGGPGGLPCEFAAGEAAGLECNNLPRPRN